MFNVNHVFPSSKYFFSDKEKAYYWGKMIPDLQCLIPYIQEDTIGDVSLTLLLQLLSNPSLINSASAVDHQTLLLRVTTLLKSNHSVTRWRATKLLTVCLLHPVLLLSSNTANAIAALVKILETKCFITNFSNPTERELITLKSTVECLGFVLDQIRGKPTLTREVLTPKLPGVIASLIDVVTLVPESSLTVLNKILINNTTTFRPFGSKFEVALRNVLNNGENLLKMESKTRALVMRSLALVSFILARERQADVWRENVNNTVLELKSVISIYEACLDLTNDSDYNGKFHSLPKLPENLASMNLTFGTLSIDINDSPVEIFKVSQRIHALVELLIAYISIVPPTAVSIPFGHYLIIGEILSSFNTSFTPVRKDIRDPATRKMIEQSINESKFHGIALLHTLVDKFSGDLYPHMYRILSILDASIPVQTFKGKIRVDENAVYENEALVRHVLTAASAFLQLSERFNDMSVLGRLVESALILKDAKEPAIPTDIINNKSNGQPQNSSGSRKKQSKSKTVISLSDLLSHKEYFISPPSADTLATIRKFFNTLITKCELSPGKMSQIIRFVIIDAISNAQLVKEGRIEEENKDIVTLLESILLFPGKTPTSVSVIPMISNIIGSNSRIYSILVNPRFPLMPKKHNDFTTEYERREIEEEEEKEAAELEDGEFVIPEIQTESEKRDADEAEAETARETKRQKVESVSNQVSAEHGEFVFQNSETAIKALDQMKKELEEDDKHPHASLGDKVSQETEIAEDNNMIASETEQAVEEDDDDEEMGSDFEIPEINVD
jgi:pre-rRNA-processing protein RIX1